MVRKDREELKEELKKEIKQELKEENEKKQSQQMSRRDFIKKMGLGAAGLGAIALAPAAADINIQHDGDMRLHNSDLDLQDNNIDNAQNIETETLDVRNDDENVEGIINTGQVYIGNPERPLISNSTETETVTVPGDYDTIQEALNKIPLINRSVYNIDIEAGTYNEDVVVPQFFGAETSQKVTADGRTGHTVIINGDTDNPEDVKIGSIYVSGALGRFPLDIRGVTILNDTPYDSDANAAGIAIYGSNECRVHRTRFGDEPDSLTNGLMVYQSDCELSYLDFGEGNCAEHGVVTKHTGYAWEQKSNNTSCTGEAQGYAYWAQEGRIEFRQNASDLSGEEGLVRNDSDTKGVVYDVDNDRDFTLTRVERNFQFGGAINLNANIIEGFRELDNGSSGDLQTRELAIDTNIQGTGNTALLYRDSDGTTHYFEPDGQL